MRVLSISSAYGGCLASVVESDAEVARGRIGEEMGLAASLPAMIENLLDGAGRGLDLVAVVVGPGSFTGLRAGLSVAAGLGLALGVPVVGVTVAEALSESLPDLRGRALWTAIEARRGRIFLDRGSGFEGWATDALPAALGGVALCGNAAMWVAASLAARGADVRLTDARQAPPLAVARVALRRAAGGLAPLAPQPLYVDWPEAKLPAGGLRAAPV